MVLSALVRLLCFLVAMRHLLGLPVRKGASRPPRRPNRTGQLPRDRQAIKPNKTQLVVLFAAPSPGLPVSFGAAGSLPAAVVFPLANGPQGWCALGPTRLIASCRRVVEQQAPWGPTTRPLLSGVLRVRRSAQREA